MEWRSTGGTGADDRVIFYKSQKTIGCLVERGIGSGLRVRAGSYRGGTKRKEEDEEKGSGADGFKPTPHTEVLEGGSGGENFWAEAVGWERKGGM